MTQNTPMSPEIKAFVDKVMPKGRGRHVLALGEKHDEKDHTDYFNTHLSTLIHDHDLGTIGLEIRTYSNVFFWAYQDGTLEKMLGSKENARQYLRQVFSSYTGEYKDAFIRKGELAIAALDQGVRVVGFDCRGSICNDFSTIADKKWRLSEEDKLKMRTDKDSFPNYTRTSAWMHTEVAELCRVNPVYRERIDRMERLVKLGQKKKIGYDALSAIVMDVAAAPDKNIVTFSGDRHVDARGDVHDHGDIEKIHGTFPDHIRWLGHADSTGFFENDTTAVPEVQTAIFAGNGWLPKMLEQRTPTSRKHGLFSQRDKPAVSVNIDTDTVAPIPMPKKEYVVPMLTRFMNPYSLNDTKVTVSQRINPYLIPAIKQLADALRADWNPGLAEERSR